MKTALQLILTILIPSLGLAAEPKIAIRAHFLEMPADTKVPNDITQLYTQAGIDVLSAPRVTTQSGKTAKITVGRDFTVANKGKFRTGLSFSCTPTLKGKRINYKYGCELTEFIGFSEGTGSKSPVFNTRKVIGMNDAANMGETALVAFPSGIEQQKITDKYFSIISISKTRTVERKVILVLTFDKA